MSPQSNGFEDMNDGFLNIICSYSLFLFICKQTEEASRNNKNEIT